MFLTQSLDPDGPKDTYGKIRCVERPHKLHDELKYESLDALTAGIHQDCQDARAYFASLPPS